MNSHAKKKKHRTKSAHNKYQIYGIFNREENKIVYVDLDMDNVLFEFELEGYNSETHDVISFGISLS